MIALDFDWSAVTAEREDDEPTPALLAADGMELDRRFVFGAGDVLRVKSKP